MYGRDTTVLCPDVGRPTHHGAAAGCRAHSGVGGWRSGIYVILKVPESAPTKPVIGTWLARTLADLEGDGSPLTPPTVAGGAQAAKAQEQPGGRLRHDVELGNEAKRADVGDD
jgi:hypothetical protein